MDNDDDSSALLSGWPDNIDDDDEEEEYENSLDFEYDEDEQQQHQPPSKWTSFWSRFTHFSNPSVWLMQDSKYDETGRPYFDDDDAGRTITTVSWTLQAFVRRFLFNPLSPDFTSLQLFCWAVLIGIAMGFYTALWKKILERGLDIMWETLPVWLLQIGVFTDVDGAFPLYHYMWIVPATLGGALSYIFEILPLPIPDQNEWIDSVHARGVQDYRTFFTLFVLSTIGMLSGLSLGPELPLILTAGMAGSWLGVACK